MHADGAGGRVLPCRREGACWGRYRENGKTGIDWLRGGSEKGERSVLREFCSVYLYFAKATLLAYNCVAISNYLPLISLEED